jgi:hypothetical protein
MTLEELQMFLARMQTWSREQLHVGSVLIGSLKTTATENQRNRNVGVFVIESSGKRYRKPSICP